MCLCVRIKKGRETDLNHHVPNDVPPCFLFPFISRLPTVIFKTSATTTTTTIITIVRCVHTCSSFFLFFLALFAFVFANNKNLCKTASGGGLNHLPSSRLCFLFFSFPSKRTCRGAPDDQREWGEMSFSWRYTAVRVRGTLPVRPLFTAPRQRNEALPLQAINFSTPFLSLALSFISFGVPFSSAADNPPQPLPPPPASIDLYTCAVPSFLGRLLSPPSSLLVLPRCLATCLALSCLLKQRSSTTSLTSRFCLLSCSLSAGVFGVITKSTFLRPSVAFTICVLLRYATSARLQRH